MNAQKVASVVSLCTSVPVSLRTFSTQLKASYEKFTAILQVEDDRGATIEISYAICNIYPYIIEEIIILNKAIWNKSSENINCFLNSSHDFEFFYIWRYFFKPKAERLNIQSHGFQYFTHAESALDKDKD